MPTLDLDSAIASVTPSLPLPTLLTSLKTLTTTLQLATSQTNSFPPLQTQLHQTTLRATHLLSQTGSALSAFSQAANSALETLQDKDLPEQTLALLHSEQQQRHDRLAKRCKNLAVQFADLASDLSTTLSEAVETRVQCLKRKKELSQQVADQFLSLSQTREQVQAADLAQNEATRLHDAAEDREANARWQASALQVVNVAAMVTSVMSTRSANLSLVGLGGCAALSAHTDAQIARAREERAVHLRQKMDARKERLKYSQKAVELQERLRGVREEEVLAEEVLQAVEKAVEALREMGGVLLQAEVFWNGVAEGGGEIWWKAVGMVCDEGVQWVRGGRIGLLE